ncbi:hypothetical protein, partial [Burkholderia ambifaria]|uniref:hypothetical protein n=1 Tax=Burkholderia ambifaria TaxID=152480 RepID=UPI001ABB1916
MQAHGGGTSPECANSASFAGGGNLSAFLWVRRLNNTGYPRACINRSPNRIANWFIADFQSKAA